MISLRVPQPAATLESSETKAASNSDSCSSSEGAVAMEGGREGELAQGNGGGTTVPIHCASDDGAFDSRCARPFHIHCTVTPEDKLTDIDS